MKHQWVLCNGRETGSYTQDSHAQRIAFECTQTANRAIFVHAQAFIACVRVRLRVSDAIVTRLSQVVCFIITHQPASQESVSVFVRVCVCFVIPGPRSRGEIGRVRVWPREPERQMRTQKKEARRMRNTTHCITTNHLKHCNLIYMLRIVLKFPHTLYHVAAYACGKIAKFTPPYFTFHIEFACFMGIHARPFIEGGVLCDFDCSTTATIYGRSIDWRLRQIDLFISVCQMVMEPLNVYMRLLLDWRCLNACSLQLMFALFM